ncbi:MAG: aminoglycoside phosphotransferase family protein [Pseudomonadota bacterium]|jgi:hypothetical protein
MPDGPLIAGIASLLGLPAGRAPEIGLEPLAPGGNNRVFAATIGACRYLVKQYFRDPSDPRDRLHAEQAFLRYAAAAGIGCVPRAIAADARLGIGIYEFVSGRKMTAADISAARVDEAAAFFLRLNDAAHRSAARALPVASEACFSIAEHFAMVDRRTARLAAIPVAADVDRAARDFVGELVAVWEELKQRIAREAAIRGEALDAAVAQRCISPSDFGFQNALVRDTGELCFLDFEYAGWDDPAKMAGDFFSHPALPVPREHFDRFVRAAMSFSPRAPALEERARLLLPVFRAKWCCIMLNDFVPEFARRRRFADPDTDEEARKRRQLDKARRLLESIE